MEVDGVGSGRDYKLYPGGGREWDWKETDTHHVPGIQPADVEELLAHGSKVIVLSRGMHPGPADSARDSRITPRARRALSH